MTNLTFKYSKGYSLVGSWMTEPLPMTGEEVIVSVPDGVHTYKYVSSKYTVHEIWEPTTFDSDGDLVNILAVNCELPELRQVHFEFGDRRWGNEEIELYGSWNDWKKPLTLGRCSDYVWVCWFTLPPGRYEYKFKIIDDKTSYWMTDPFENKKCNLGQWNENSILIV